jgi:hypothetical protein
VDIGGQGPGWAGVGYGRTEGTRIGTSGHEWARVDIAGHEWT